MTTPNHSNLHRGMDYISISRNDETVFKLGPTGEFQEYPRLSLSATTPDDNSTAFNDKTYSFQLHQMANVVTLIYNGDAAAETDSNNKIKLSGVIPSARRPDGDRTFLVGGMDNASSTPLSVTVKSSSGDIEISVQGSAFTNGEDARVDAFSISWLSSFSL